MSLRTVLRLSLIAILTLIVAGPGSAQAKNPWRIHTAPMPREKSAGTLRLEFGIEIGSGPVLHGREVGFDRTPTTVPWSRTVPPMIIQAEEEFIQGESGGQLRITPMPVAPSRPLGSSQLALQREFGIAQKPGNNPFSVRFSCAPPTAQCLPACGEMTYTWTFNCPSLASPMAGTCAPRIVYPVAPTMMPQYTDTGSQYPLTHIASNGCNHPGGWWLDATPVPQPRHAMPVVVVQQVRELGPAMVADVRSFGFRMGSECPVSVLGHAQSSVGASSRSCCQSEPSGCCEKEDKLSGTWYREIEGAVFSAAFCGDELKICMTQREEGSSICFTLTADYAITKEGLVHGVVTGVDIDAKLDPISPAGARCSMPPAAMAAELQKFVDCPFSFRTKSTSAGVMVSNLRFAAAGMDMEQLALVCGMFKPAPNGNVPSPKAMRTSVASPACCEALTYPPVVASPYQPVPATSGTMPPASMPVVLPAAGTMLPSQAVPQSWTPTKPTNVPAGEFGMMADVFVQMLGTKPQPMPVPAPPAVYAGSSAAVPTMQIPTPPQIEKPK